MTTKLYCMNRYLGSLLFAAQRNITLWAVDDSLEVQQIEWCFQLVAAFLVSGNATVANSSQGDDAIFHRPNWKTNFSLWLQSASNW